ncbi:hypothetical protein [Micromonospora rifamycinica]|uniref:hypothetical protein n=1 Tax=Micromonospora rifamycinica TaxID=291594 RepID=UPI00082EC40E|nr:hypothetical protein [Micromonospora rifamycinica]
MLGRRSVAPPGRPWATDLTEDSRVDLADQLTTVMEFLRDRLDVLEHLRECDIDLTIGWTPRAPQDGIALDTEMVTLLHRVRCAVLLDTYRN